MTRIPTILTAAVLTAVLGAPAAAQQGQPGGRQPTPEMQARLRQMQPVLDLAQTVRLLPELEKTRATAMTRAQARQLLPILLAVQKATAVQPAQAKAFLAQIEDTILTDAQLTALDDLMLRAEQARAARRAQAQAGGGAAGVRVPGVPGGLPGGLGGARPGGPGGGGQDRAGQGGTGQPGTFNPFRQGRQADALRAYIAALQKK